jgi:3-hydroxypropanoate dehydrogenase
MKQPLSPQALQQLFTEARTHHFWQNKDVSDDLLRELYGLTKWGPTAVNASPMRILFVKSKEQKEKLLPALSGSNVEQVKSAPVTAIVAFDERFYDLLPKLFPAFDAKAMFVSNKAVSEITAFRNAGLQGGYLMIAARALGLDVGPMSGFDNAKVDEAFFSGTSWRSNFLCNLGYGEDGKLYPRGPRLEFDEACKIV